jgi:ATP-binding cassette subfamily B protein RaxB
MISLSLKRKVPVYLQNEATECGLCCIAMVADYLGYRTDLASLRLQFAVSRKGASLASLVRIAKVLKLEPRAVKLDMGAVSKLTLPCVIHWDMDHFVVLTSVSSREAVIHDPAVGRRVLPLDEFGKYFTGIALELKPANDFTPVDRTTKYTIRGLMGSITGLKRGLGQVFMLAVALECVVIALPFFLQWTVDQALPSADSDLLTTLALGFGLLILIQGAIHAVRNWLLISLSTNLNFQWYGNVFGHLVRLPLDYFEKRHIGSIISSFGSISTIQRSVTTTFVQAVVDGVMVLGTLIMMVLYNTQLAMISFAAIIIYTALRLSLFNQLRAAAAEQIVFVGKQNTHFYETVNGIQSVRLFGQGDERRAGWMNLLAEQFNAELRINRIGVNYESARTVLFGIERVIVVWLAGRAVLDNAFSVGMLFAFIAYKDQFSTRISALVDRLLDLRMLGLHGERIADIVLTPAEDEGDLLLGESAHEKGAPSIELRNISFRYSATEPYVFEDINLFVEAGESIAITGPSGCGKTTLVKIMLGLLEPSSGEVLVNGVPIKRIGLANFRSTIGTVMQEDRLFSGSIAENICFFDSVPDWERIKESAKLASLAHEIEAMPMGYYTMTGANGAGISGGQQQRLLLARALYRQPHLLVLDEATSELDVGNERTVNATIREMGLTRIMVAHRPDTIAMADRVVQLRNGRLSDAANSNLHALQSVTT